MDKSTEKALRIALLNLKELYLYSEYHDVKRIGELIYKAAQIISGDSAPENTEFRYISTISDEAKERLEKAAKEAEEYVRSLKSKGDFDTPVFKCKSDRDKCLETSDKVECWLLYLLCIASGFFTININTGE